MNISDGKIKILNATKQLLDEDIIIGSWGNISCRINTDESAYPDQGSFLITAGGREDFSQRDEDQVVEVGLEDFSYEGDIKPSLEHRIHAAIYRNHPEINVIIHTHQTNATAVSVLEMDRIKFTKEYANVGNFVLCSPYALSGSRRLIGNVAKTVAETDKKAVIMKNHGAICFGDSFEDAIAVSKSLEEACGDYLSSLGIETCDISGWNLEGFNMSPSIEKYLSIRDSLPAYISSFAQIIGSELQIIDEDDTSAFSIARSSSSPILVRGKGLHCYGDNKHVTATIVEQNCMAALAAIGTKPLDALRCRLIHEQYRWGK